MQFLYELLHILLPLYFLNVLIGITSWPFTSFFFGRLKDKGYAISHIVGWFAIGYIYFFLAAFKLITLNPLSITLIFLLWIGINILIEARFRIIKKYFSFKTVGKIQLVFILLFSFFYILKCFQPEIYQVERFMDFAIIQSLLNTNTLPLNDMWLTGNPLNYYYFGHFLGYLQLEITQIKTAEGFFALGGVIFSLIGINAYNFGESLYSHLQEEKLDNSYKSVLAGIGSIFFTLLAGTMHSLIWLSQFLNYQWVIFSKQLSPDALKALPDPSFWYADPTRFIDGTITDIPIYTFLVHDLHAQVWGMLTGVIVISLLYCLWHDASIKLNLRNKYIYLLSFFIGTAYMISSWDALTLGVLTVFTVYFKYRNEVNSSLTSILSARSNDWIEDLSRIIIFPLIPSLALLVGFPWDKDFEAPIFGIGMVRNSSILWKWLMFWGAPIILLSLFLIKTSLQIGKNSIKLNIFQKNSFIWIIFFVAGLFFFQMEVIYIQDILKDGEWYRANMVWKIGLQLWLWMGMILGPVVVWMVDRSFQTNLSHEPNVNIDSEVMPTEGKSSKNLFEFIFDLFSFVIVWIICSLLVIYPIQAMWQASWEHKKFTGISAGLNWWKDRYPSDYEAYAFLAKIRDGLPRNDRVRVILETDGESYKDYNMFSVYLGWPTVLGWPIHEWTWHGSDSEVSKRSEEIRKIYTGDDLEETKVLLNKYKIDYIIIGEIETQKFGDNIKTEKLMNFGDIVFKNSKTKIIEIRN